MSHTLPYGFAGCHLPYDEVWNPRSLRYSVYHSCDTFFAWDIGRVGEFTVLPQDVGEKPCYAGAMISGKSPEAVSGCQNQRQGAVLG